MISSATILTAIAKAYVDHKRWPFENHWVGALVVVVVLSLICYLGKTFHPIFLYGMLFNPVLNLMQGLPFFYMGETATTDKVLKSLFGRKAGQFWFFGNVLGLILTI